MAQGPVTIHCFSPHAAPVDQLAAELTDEESSRAEAFRFPRDAGHWITCRAMLRRILGASLGIPPRDVPLISSPFGKPLLAPPFDRLFFNLSHAPELALVAIHRHGPVGIDLEPITRATSLPGCESTFCHPEEIAALPDDEIPRAMELLRIWTAKEAYLKALGTGFSTAPQTIRIITRGDDIIAAAPSHQARLIRLPHPALIPYHAHLCVLQASSPPQIIWLPESRAATPTSG